MPYIDPARRQELALMAGVDTPGEMNFLISCLIWEYYSSNKNYQAINDVIGALEGAKLEFTRRVMYPYEDKKIIENGDVYI
jgi:hypothetical protein